MKSRLFTVLQGIRTRDRNIQSENAESSLPDCLRRKILYLIIYAVLIGAAAFAMLFRFRTVQCLLGLVFPCYFIMSATSLRRDFYTGKIVSKTVICCSIKPRFGRNASRVVFRQDFNDDSTPPEYFEFILPGTKSYSHVFMPGYVYIIFFRPDDAKNLVGLMQL